MQNKEKHNNNPLVFVYGTLLKGRSNHDRFLSNAHFICEGIAPGFALYNLGYFPGAVYSEGDSIKGELYRVTLEDLERLDYLEDEGRLYIRKKTDVASEDIIYSEVYIYVYNHSVSNYKKVTFENQPWNKEYA